MAAVAALATRGAATLHERRLRDVFPLLMRMKVALTHA